MATTNDGTGTGTTNASSGGTDWGALAALLAGLVSGKSWSGQPQQQVNNTGPMTPEGAALWNEYNTILQQTPAQTTYNIGGQSITVPSRHKMGILNAMLNLDRNRNPMAAQPAQSGIAGDLAQLLPLLLKNNTTGTTQDTSKNNSLSSLLSGLFSSGNQGSGDTSWMNNIYGTSSGE